MNEIINPRVQLVIDLNERKNINVSLADIIRYQTETNNGMGSGFKWNEEGMDNREKFMEIFCILFPEIEREFNDNKMSIVENKGNFLSDVAVACIKQIQTNTISSLSDVFNVCELTLNQAVEELQKDIAVSFLEDFQTLFFNYELDYKLIEPYLQPTTLWWWNEIDGYWKKVAEYKNKNK